MRTVRILSYLLIGFIALGIIRFQQLTETYHTQQTSIDIADIKPTVVPETAPLPYLLHRPAEKVVTSPLTPRNALAQLREEYRLPPDRRFILAFIEMQKFLAPGSPSNFEVHFNNGKWYVMKNDDQVAMLSEFPDFLEAKEQLLRFSEQLLPNVEQYASSQTRGMENKYGFSLHKAQQVLLKLNHQWQDGNHDFESIRQAADALTRLSWAARDLLESQDSIMAHALAFTVLAERGLRRTLVRQESMLAEAMSYHAHAQQLVAQLEQEDPWRLYMQGNVDLLGKAAKRSYADADSIDLWLQQLADDDQWLEWTEWFKNHYGHTRAPVFAMQTAYSLRGFYPKTVAMRLMPLVITAANITPAQNDDEWLKRIEAVAEYLPREQLILIKQIIAEILRSDSSFKPEWVLNSIENKANDYDGPFLSRSSYRSYYQGIYFASLYQLGLHYLDKRNDIEQASSFSEYLSDSNHPDMAELSTWYKNLVNAEKNKTDMASLLRDMYVASHIGVTTLERTLDELLPHYRYGSTDITGAVNLLFSRLDSRISHRFILANKARANLLYLGLGEKLYNSIQQGETGRNPYLTAWLANYNDQPAEIFKVIRDETAALYHRKRAAELLLKRDPVPPEIQPVLFSIIEQYPDNWATHEVLIKYLEDRAEYASAITVAQHWLDSSDENSRLAFDYWKAIIAISQQQLNQNDPDGAWETISSITDTWYGYGLYQAARIKVAQSDLDSALELSTRALSRYPTSQHAITCMAEILWQRKNYTDAAVLLAKNKGRFADTDWRWLVGDRFAETFAKNPEFIPDAFAAMKAQQLDSNVLMNIARAVGQKGLYRAAFIVMSELESPGPGQIQFYVDAFDYLEKTEGREAAIAWLDKKIPENMRNFSSLIFFSNQDFSLLWDMIPAPEVGQYPETVWLYRAAGFVQGAKLDPKRKSELMAYFQQQNQNKYIKMGRLVLGIDNGEELLDTAMNPRTLSETAFYLALAALNNTDYEEAADWFKLSTHYSSPSNGEYRWSHSLLYNWNNRAQSLQTLAKNGKLLPEAK